MENVKHKFTEISQTRVRIEVEIPKEMVAAEIETAFAKIQKNASISGFRTGKVPKEIIREKFEQNASQHAKEQLILKTLPDIIKLKKLNETQPPVVEKMDFGFNKDFTYSAILEFHPQFIVKNYRGLKLKKDVKKVGVREIENAIEELKKLNTKLIEDPSTAAGNACVLISYRVFSTDKKELKELNAENQLVDLSEKQLLPGLSEALIGAKKGDKKELLTKLPVDYPKKNLSGTEIILNIDIKSVKKKVVPELNDEFVKEVGADNVDDLHNKILKRFSLEYEAKSEESVEEQIINQLIEQNPVHPPESFIESQKKYLLKISMEKIKREGYPQDFIDKQIASFENKAREEAERQIKISYIYSSIAELEKIDVSEAEFNKKRSEAIQMNPDRKEFIEKYFNEGKERLISKMKTDKILKFIKDNAKIKIQEVG